MVWANALDRQRADPHGLAGGLAGLFMLNRPSSRARARWVVSLLDVQPHDRVLDVGIGPGYSTGLIAESLGQGVIVGVDRSALMMAMTRWRLRELLHRRTVTLVHADAMDLPHFNIKFTKVVAINSLQFQDDPHPLLTILHQRMAPGGLIAVAIQASGRGVNLASTQKLGSQVAASLRSVGFERPQVHVNGSLRRTPCVCVVARA